MNERIQPDRDPSQSEQGGTSTRDLLEAPKLSGGLPFIGHSAEFVRDTVGLLFRARREQGDVVRFNLVGKNVVFCSGLAAQEAVFRAKDEILSPSEAYRLMIPVFGKGVVYDCEPDRMMEQLNMLRPALQIKRMRTYGEHIAHEVELSIKDWGERGVVDFIEYATVLTNYTSSRCLLGKEFREELTEEFGQVYHDLERSIVPIAYLNANLPLPVFRRRDQARKRLGEMVSEILASRRKNGFEGQDFMQTLMEASYSDGSTLTDHEITGILIAGMFAGHHTSSVTTTWTLFELLRHPEHLAEVVAEIDDAYEKEDKVSYLALRDLVKTEAIIKETLRLHPPLFLMFRVAVQDTEIAGYQIRKGDWVAVSPLVGHSIDEIFSNADEFDPGRYAPDRAEDRQPFSYISFGGGRHKCLGNAFAMLQIKAIMAILLRRYEFSIVDDDVTPDFQGLVIGPKRPCRVRYRRRRLNDTNKSTSAN